MDNLINLIEKPDFLLIFHHTTFFTLNSVSYGGHWAELCRRLFVCQGAPKLEPSLEETQILSCQNTGSLSPTFRGVSQQAQARREGLQPMWQRSQGSLGNLKCPCPGSKRCLLLTRWDSGDSLMCRNLGGPPCSSLASVLTLALSR